MPLVVLTDHMLTLAAFPWNLTLQIKSTASLAKTFWNSCKQWLLAEVFIKYGCQFACHLSTEIILTLLVFQANGKMANDYWCGPRENFFWRKSNAIAEQHNLHQQVKNTSRASNLEEPVFDIENGWTAKFYILIFQFKFQYKSITLIFFFLENHFCKLKNDF